MAATQRGFPLLERAVHYGLSSLDMITPAALFDPTPCAGWNLFALLEHLTESLAVLREGPCDGRIGGHPAMQCAEDVLADVRARAESLLRDWQFVPPSTSHFAVDDLPIPVAAVEIVAAIEIAVHGWTSSRPAERRTLCRPTCPDDFPAGPGLNGFDLINS
jgi:hypothetical protein